MIPKIIKNITPVKINSSTSVDLYSPWDLKKIAKIDCINAEDIDSVINTSSKAFSDKSIHLNKKERLDILKKAKKLLTKDKNKYSMLIAFEGGKPLKDSEVEVQRAIDGLELCYEALKNSHGREIPMGLNNASINKIAFTRKFPIGPVLAISAFNHPLNLIVHQIGPAIAAGCPIIIKPSLDTPATCHEFVKLLLKSGLPDWFCQMININDHLLTQKLVSDKRISFLSFIGSSNVGWKLKSMLSPGTKCAMEHGGIGSVIIDKNTILGDIIPSITRGSFYHAGQVCVSIQKVIIHEEIIDEFIKLLKKNISKIKIGDPTNNSTDVGPLIRPSEVIRIDGVVKKAIKDGAELICGGSKETETSYKCTVLKNPKESSEISKNEIFGPVLCIYSYKEINDAINKANHDEYAFQTSIYTNNIETALLCYEKLDAKSVFVNEQTAFRVDWMPFGGIKNSGEGTGGIEYSFSDLLYDKMIVLNSKKITT